MDHFELLVNKCEKNINGKKESLKASSTRHAFEQKHFLLPNINK